MCDMNEIPPRHMPYNDPFLNNQNLPQKENNVLQFLFGFFFFYFTTRYYYNDDTAEIFHDA